ncbi:MAG: substrate-binding domain-containing protein [Oscillospiraceae bacterium]|nr:substrate-binding domain-containing protein [Oscillospiraceae bacterium]
MKKTTAMLLASLLLFSLTACATQKNENFSGPITVVSREDGSGTRGAFIELFGIEVKNNDGTKKDLTTKEAITADKTDIMMTNIAGDPNAIGYISLGSLNDSIKALEIDGAAASVENVKNGSYSIQRPFNIAVKGEAEGLTKDFIDFILSAQGQEVVEARQYIAIAENAPAFSSSRPSGKIVVAGSSSVTPLMEKLREAYLVINPSAAIEVQLGDTNSGMTMAINGTCDIGMASRALKESELAQLTEIAIALDGIAVIVNNQNAITGLSSEQVKDIFTGAALNWSDIA